MSSISFTSLEAMAESDAFMWCTSRARCPATFPQTQLFLSHKIHVICEKPLASNLAEVDAAIACAREIRWCCSRHQKPPPNFHLLRQALPKVANRVKSFSRLPVFLALSTLPGR
ncbi:Gfo/Idh/MocA family oxidoreductase [Shigella flexneri]